MYRLVCNIETHILSLTASSNAHQPGVERPPDRAVSVPLKEI